MLPAKPIRGLIIDLNGTLYFKEQALSGANKTLKALRKQGFCLRFMTNTDTRTRSQIRQLMHDYGLDIPEEEIFSAAQTTHQYLKTNRYSYLGLLPKNLKEEFRDLKQDVNHPDCILIGENQEAINYQTLDTLFRHLMNGAELIVMQPGRHYHLADGPHLDTGALGAMFEYATGQQAKIMAKPSLSFFQAVLKNMKLKAKDIAVIGDDIETDMAGASKIGARGILVKTGAYQTGDEFLSSIKPSLILESIADLPQNLNDFVH